MIPRLFRPLGSSGRHRPRPGFAAKALLLSLPLVQACVKVEVFGIIPDDSGASSTGTGTGGTGGTGTGGPANPILPKFEGGRHPAPWRAGLPPITNDVPRWYVPKTTGRYRYSADRTQSPVPSTLAERLRHVALHGQALADNVFMKVGDSISDSSHYLGCFKGDINAAAPRHEFNIVLAGQNELAEPVFHFRSATFDGTSSFDRQSKATRVGADVNWPLQGDVLPLEDEFSALRPQFASLMFGTNDLGFGGSATSPLDQKLRPYHRGLVALVDAVLERGVVPWLSTIPPRIDDPLYMEIVPVFNAVIRAVAEGRQIPLVDYFRELVTRPAFGLSGDGIHPNVQEYNTACHFDELSLRYGYNVRNFVAITALDRLMKVVVDGAASLDDDAPVLGGAGTLETPFVIDGLPFSDMRDTRDGAVNALVDYPGCAGSKSGAGAEYVYQLDLAAPTALRAIVLDGSQDHGPDDIPVDVDVYVLDASKAGQGCLASADTLVATTLDPGTYYIVVDTTRAADAAGEYVLAVVPCESADARCARARPSP